jgi:hypothetical protein
LLSTATWELQAALSADNEVARPVGDKLVGRLGAASHGVVSDDNLVEGKLRDQGLYRRDAPHWRHTSRASVHCSLWSLRHRWAHHPPPGLCQVDQCPVRRGIEKVFGWITQRGRLCQFKLRGTGNVGAVFGLHEIAYNLIWLGTLVKPAMAA